MGGDGMLGVYRQETTWSCLILVIDHAYLHPEGETLKFWEKELRGTSCDLA